MSFGINNRFHLQIDILNHCLIEGISIDMPVTTRGSGRLDKRTLRKRSHVDYFESDTEVSSWNESSSEKDVVSLQESSSFDITGFRDRPQNVDDEITEVEQAGPSIKVKLMQQRLIRVPDEETTGTYDEVPPPIEVIVID